MRFLVAVVLVSAAYGQADPKALVAQSIRNYDHDWREAMSWAYTQTDITHADDGKVVEVSEVIPVAGTPYERLISRNGEPLDKADQRKENRKYEKTVEERMDETPAESAERIRKYEKSRAFIDEVPEAYDFKLLRDEPVNGRPAWVIKLTPRMGFTPDSPHASVLRHIEGKLWIDKQDVRWARAQARVIDTISIAFILARIGPGTRFELDQTRISDDLWLPKKIEIDGSARVFMFHNKDLAEQLTFNDYHRETTSVASRLPNSLTEPRP